MSHQQDRRPKIERFNERGQKGGDGKSGKRYPAPPARGIAGVVPGSQQQGQRIKREQGAKHRHGVNERGALIKDVQRSQPVNEGGQNGGSASQKTGGNEEKEQGRGSPKKDIQAADDLPVRAEKMVERSRDGLKQGHFHDECAGIARVEGPGMKEIDSVSVKGFDRGEGLTLAEVMAVVGRVAEAPKTEEKSQR